MPKSKGAVASPMRQFWILLPYAPWRKSAASGVERTTPVLLTLAGRILCPWQLRWVNDARASVLSMVMSRIRMHWRPRLMVGG
jgi:hypothetical protein